MGRRQSKMHPGELTLSSAFKASIEAAFQAEIIVDAMATETNAQAQTFIGPSTRKTSRTWYGGSLSQCLLCQMLSSLRVFGMQCALFGACLHGSQR